MLPLAEERVPLESCAGGQPNGCSAERCGQWLGPALHSEAFNHEMAGYNRIGYNRSREEHLWQRNSSALTSDGLRIHVRPGAGRGSGVYQPPKEGVHVHV